MIAVYGSVLGASLLGSLHCAGMCGPLAALCGAAPGESRSAVGDATYHAARLVTYAALGALGGALGAGLDGVGAQLGMQRLAAAVAGATLLVWGGAMLLGVVAPSLGVSLPAPLRRTVTAALSRLRERPPLARATLLGLGSALLPCGWLYAFVLVAAGTGSALAGATTMAAFWLGTVPALLGVSLGVRTLAHRIGPRLRTLGAAALVVVGIATVVTRMGMPPPATAAPVDAAAPGAAALPTEPPCHAH